MAHIRRGGVVIGTIPVAVVVGWRPGDGPFINGSANRGGRRKCPPIETVSAGSTGRPWQVPLHEVHNRLIAALEEDFGRIDAEHDGRSLIDDGDRLSPTGM
jgi:hypothetical protein